MWYYIAKRILLFIPSNLQRPDAGKIIPGSGGLRKLRWSASGRGNVAAQGLSIIGLYPMKLFLCCSLFLRMNGRT